MGAEAAGHDFGGGGRAFVDKKDERLVGELIAAESLFNMLVRTSFERDDERVGLEEHAADFDGGGDEAAGIVPQIDDKAGRLVVRE